MYGHSQKTEKPYNFKSFWEQTRQLKSAYFTYASGKRTLVLMIITFSPIITRFNPAEPVVEKSNPLED